MGQLFNRLRDFARSQLRTTESELRWAERTIGSDDDELRRIIDELHQDYVNERSGNAHSNGGGSSKAKETPSNLPTKVQAAHRCLNVPIGSTPEQIKRAYRDMIARWHPDRFVNAAADEQQQAHARAREINAAYVSLRDHYDFR